MKKILSIVLLSSLFFVGCENIYRDEIAQIHKEIDDLKARLDAFCEETNTNIASLQTIIAALQTKDYVTGVVPVVENGVEVGYNITFEKSGTVTIYHGKDGINGEDGKDGYTPQIGVRLHTDGLYYWTLDGEWLTDENGNMIKAVGVDGIDGENGKDGEDGADGATGPQGPQGPQGDPGKDAIAPQLKIADGCWYISVDGGVTWEYLGQATGDQGPQGNTGATGPQGPQGPQGPAGEDGTDGDAFFQSVDISNPDYVTFVLADGTVIKIPTWGAFEALQEQVTQMNKNIEALQTIIAALQNNVYVTSVVPIYEGVEEIGYVINFSDNTKATIYHGQDGKDGVDGEDGVDGDDGVDGAAGQDGKTPVIGVAKDTDGVYYWTVDGAWLLDENGQKVKAVANDGQNGAPGQNGSNGVDGITPKLKIENGKWYVSYDNGANWIEIGQATGDQGPQGNTGATGPQGPQGPQGPAGEDGDSFFQSVKETDEFVSLVLADGTEIRIPKRPKLSVELNPASELAVVPGSTEYITYVITTASASPKISVMASSGWKASVQKETATTGKISVKLLSSDAEDSDLTIFVSDGESTIMEVISLKKNIGPGGYFYSDGTYSDMYDSSKTLVGIVFYIGDPTLDDTTLANAYPGCTHGLAVATNTTIIKKFLTRGGAWGNWQVIGYNASGRLSNSYIMTGYNNTQALKEYDSIASTPSNSLTYCAEMPTVAGASTWYIPSFAEFDALYGVLDDINKSLKAAGLDSLPKDYYYWTSTRYDEYGKVGVYNLETGGVSKVKQSDDSESAYILPIFAF